MINIQLSCGPFEILSKGTIMTVPDEPFVIDCGFAKIQICFKYDSTKKYGGIFSVVHDGLITFDFINLKPGELMAIPEPFWVATVDTEEKGSKRVFISFAGQRIDGSECHKISYTLYWVDENLIFPWEKMSYAAE